jgi:hypothetical protein
MRKRSFIRGLSAGIVVKVLFTVILTVALVGIAQVHGIAHGWAHLVRDGRFPPLSAGWLASQSLVFLGAALSGVACAHWCKPGSWAAPLTFALLWLAWSALKIPEGLPLGLVVFRVSVSSIGILLGALVYQRWHRRMTPNPSIERTPDGAAHVER